MKLLAAISHHGLGHLAQAAPVLNALGHLLPELELTIWSGLPASALSGRIQSPFRHRHEPADMGLIMEDALNVATSASHAALLAFHRDWPTRLTGETAWLRAEGFGAVFSDIAYLPLAAAAQAGVPGLGLCSLNWRDIYASYLSDRAGMDGLLADLEAAYGAAITFLRPTPAMPMAWLTNAEAIPPIACLGRNRRDELRERAGIPRGHRVILVGFGGIAYTLLPPRLEGVAWLIPGPAPGTRPDVFSLDGTGLSFLDGLASSDALMTKVGYGGFVEAAAHAIPVLYLDRPDWPETIHLARWLDLHGNTLAMSAADMKKDRLDELIARLLAQPRKPPVRADGADVAARRLADMLTVIG
ncbi:MAG TPA: hypothetical protein PLL19_03115 [Thiobacillaceae bacterium]|nr:hypothetical protein [Thiobacillaceae bacterium]HNF88294.1 hypothetical protein [Thiobacillaceae bacterium]HNI08075.1 hypothetical protein [Thiobacillaceae bacterium]